MGDGLALSQHDSSQTNDDQSRPRYINWADAFIEQWFGNEQDQNGLQGTDHRRIGNARELDCAKKQGNIAAKQQPTRKATPEYGPVKTPAARKQQYSDQRHADPQSLEGGYQGRL